MAVGLRPKVESVGLEAFLRRRTKIEAPLLSRATQRLLACVRQILLQPTPTVVHPIEPSDRYLLVGQDHRAPDQFRFVVVTSPQDHHGHSGSCVAPRLGFDVLRGREVFVAESLQDEGFVGNGPVDRNLQILSALQQKKVRVPQLDCSIWASNEKAFIVQEHFTEGDLARFIVRVQLGEKEKWAIAVAVLELLSKMHDLGVFHLDVKLSNFLVTVRDGQLEIAISDFGCSTRQGDPIVVLDWGSCSYNPPERVAAVLNFRKTKTDPVDHGSLQECSHLSSTFNEKSDVFQAGLLVWEMFGGNIGGLAQKTLKEQDRIYRTQTRWNCFSFPPCALKDPRAQAGLRQLLKKMMCFDPDLRCNMAEALADARECLAMTSRMQINTPVATNGTAEQTQRIQAFFRIYTVAEAVSDEAIQKMFRQIAYRWEKIRDNPVAWNTKFGKTEGFPRSVVVAPGLDHRLHALILTSKKAGDPKKVAFLLPEGRVCVLECGRKRSLQEKFSASVSMSEGLDSSVACSPLMFWGLPGRYGRDKFYLLHPFTPHETLDRVLARDGSQMSEERRWQITVELLRILKDLEARHLAHLNLQASKVVVKQDAGTRGLQLAHFDWAKSHGMPPNTAIQWSAYSLAPPERIAAVLQGQRFLLPQGLLSKEQLLHCAQMMDRLSSDEERIDYLQQTYPDTFRPNIVPTGQEITEFIEALNNSCSPKGDLFQAAFVIMQIHGHFMKLPKTVAARSEYYKNPRWWQWEGGDYEAPASDGLSRLLEGICYPVPEQRWTAERAHRFATGILQTIQGEVA